MLSVPQQMRVFIAVEPIDMRKQFDGLWSLAQDRLGEDPRLGGLFVFTNKPRTRLKILYFDGTGVWVFSKRLEQGRLSWPLGSDACKLSIDPAALTMLINGIDLKKGMFKAWYER